MPLPAEFIQRTEALFGPSLWQRFTEALREAPPVSIRLNPLKFNPATMPLPAEEDGRVPWTRGLAAEGIYLKRRPQFTLDPLLHAGAYYVQEAASMFVAQVLSRHAPLNAPLAVLDLCAAPGGKSTALAAMLPPGSVLLCNEPDRRRCNILVENIQKQGHPDVMVTNNLPRDYKGARLQFDVVLCDVPCSGEGMFRKDEAAVGEWSVANVKRCASLQREILSDIAGCLRPGGLLIYSTCTFNPEEDEGQLSDELLQELGLTLLSCAGEDDDMTGDDTTENHNGAAAEQHNADAQSDTDPDGDAAADTWQLPAGNSPILTRQGRCARFIPGVTRSEGLFMAAMRKQGESPAVMSTAAQTGRSGKKQKTGRGQKPSGNGAQLLQWLSEPDRYTTAPLGNLTVALSQQLRPFFERAQEKLRVMHAGVELAEQKGRDQIPTQGLALSAALSATAFPRAELTLERALAYLRREPVALPPGAPRGFVLATYLGLPLGFMKNLGPRANNLYPKEWRVRIN